VEFTPQRVQPLTLAELHGAARGANRSCQMAWGATEFVIDGSTTESGGILKSMVVFQEAPRPYALVPGGWLPLPLAIPPRFLVDRNVVADLHKLRTDPERTDLRGLPWWMQLTDHGEALFNPFPYAWEGGHERAPDDAEFLEAFEAGAAAIRAALPGAAVVAYGLAEYRDVHEIRAFFEASARREAAFLQTVCPLIVDRVRQGQEAHIEAKIFEHCERHGVGRNSFACMAALSCLYEDRQGAAYLIGREVLKPSHDYSAKAAYNAVCDLGHLTLAIISGALYGNQGFALATSDLGLASLWCALRPVARLDNVGDIDIVYDISPEMFPRLTTEGLVDSPLNKSLLQINQIIKVWHPY
jgi:hypothetical protein